MANNVKWIKMMVGMFDGMSFKKIKRAKIGGESFRDKLTAVWFELMDFAGKCNHDGAFISPSEIPFTDLADIATMIDRDEEELRLCMAFFINEGMVKVVDDIYSLSNWSEYQNVEGMEKLREQNRKRVADFRERQKRLLLTDGATCVYCGKPANTIDHIIPRSKNGSNDESNIVPCCKSCNSSKKNKSLADFLNDSFYYHYEGVNHDLVRSNPKLMRYVAWDSALKRYSNVTVTESNAPDKEEDKEREVEREIDVESKTSREPIEEEKKKTANAVKKETASRFQPPSVDDVRKYCRERGNGVDAEQFVDFYTSKNWMVGKNRMRDWKAAVRTWEVRDGRPRTVQTEKKQPSKYSMSPKAPADVRNSLRDPLPNEMVEYPAGSNRYIPYWEAPGYDG